MALIINTAGIELTPPASYIEKAGNYIFKIEKIELDGFNDEGSEKFKMHFKAFQPENKEVIYSHIERFSLAKNMLWKLKQLEVALKSPEHYDVESWVGRYVIGTVSMREYNGKNYADIKSYEYSKFNDKLDPIPEFKGSVESAIVEDDILEDAIPF